MKWHAYFRLMRLDKPVGILLLWYPTAWSLWMANQGTPSTHLLWLFLLGTVLMRTAGCLLNDIADRHIDLHVKRTQLRPLTSGEVSLFETMGWLTLTLTGSLWVVLQLPLICFFYACGSLALTLVYPFCKRFLKAPQCILGLTFSMGIPMAYCASNASFDEPMMLLFVLNAAWIIAYDTQYAMADRDDDITIGIHSTAILFAQYDRCIIGLLQIFFHGLWWVLIDKSTMFYSCWVLGAMTLLYQQWLIKDRTPKACFSAFRTNSVYGLLMWLAFF